MTALEIQPSRWDIEIWRAYTIQGVNALPKLNRRYAAKYSKACVKSMHTGDWYPPLLPQLLQLPQTVGEFTPKNSPKIPCHYQEWNFAPLAFCQRYGISEQKTGG